MEVMSNLADGLRALAAFDESLSVYMSLAKLKERVYGPGSVEVSDVRGDQAGVLYAKGAFSEATELYAQVLKSKRLPWRRASLHASHWA